MQEVKIVFITPLKIGERAVGNGKSRSTLYKADSNGNVTILSSRGTISFNAGRSWEELVSLANESNNYFNTYPLEALQDGFYRGSGKRYFDEDSLYIANQSVKAYEILRDAVGGNELFMYPNVDAIKGVPRKELSRIAIGAVGDIPINGVPIRDLALNNGGTFAMNKGGNITLNTAIWSRSQNRVIDLRNPKEAETYYRNSYLSKWSSTDSTVGTILHEYGHSVQGVLALNPKYRKVWNTFMKETDNGINQVVSDYAGSYKNKQTRMQENFAEAFSAYLTGKEFRGAPDYERSFIKLMNSVGIKSSSYKSSNVPKVTETINTEPSIFKKTRDDYVPIPVTTKVSTKVSTPKSSVGSVKKIRTASNFTKSSISISGTIRGKNFTATITDGIRNRGYIERTIGNTKYRIDINTGAFTKVD